MKSFQPLLWYNRTDLFFDYDLDKTVHPGSRKESMIDRKYGYEFFKEPLADGVLVSRTMVEDKIKVTFDETGQFTIRPSWHKPGFNHVRDYLSLRFSDYYTFADPGTWSFVNYFKLPDYLFEHDNLIDYYHTLGFDLAGSVDWPIVDKIRTKVDGKIKFVELDGKTKEYRRQLTLDMAEAFLKHCQKREVSFIPFGTVQGWDKPSYRLSLRRVLKMRYPYIAIGGLPSSSEKFVVELLNDVIGPEIKRSGYRPGVHMYGRFPSPGAVGDFLKNYVTSFDNNSAYIEATKGNSGCWHPIFMTDFTRHSTQQGGSSIKIPHIRAKAVTKAKKTAKCEEDYDKLLAHCEKTFKLFIKYSHNPTNKLLRIILKYYEEIYRLLNHTQSTNLTEAKIKKLVDIGKYSLETRVWELCGCTSCKMLKAHIILIRGCRFQHTFLHNCHVQYVRLKKEIAKAKRLVEYTPFDWSQVSKLRDTKITRRKAVKK